MNEDQGRAFLNIKDFHESTTKELLAIKEKVNW